MAFIQIVESRSSRLDEIQAVADEFEKATEGRRTVRRSIVTTDRDDPTRHFVIVFFDSYESAMENSNLPETQEFSQKMQTLVDGPPTFYNLDVSRDQSF